MFTVHFRTGATPGTSSSAAPMSPGTSLEATSLKKLCGVGGCGAVPRWLPSVHFPGRTEEGTQGRHACVTCIQAAGRTPKPVPPPACGPEAWALCFPICSAKHRPDA